MRAVPQAETVPKVFIKRLDLSTQTIGTFVGMRAALQAGTVPKVFIKRLDLSTQTFGTFVGMRAVPRQIRFWKTCKLMFYEKEEL